MRRHLDGRPAAVAPQSAAGVSSEKRRRLRRSARPPRLSSRRPLKLLPHRYVGHPWRQVTRQSCSRLDLTTPVLQLTGMRVPLPMRRWALAQRPCWRKAIPSGSQACVERSAWLAQKRCLPPAVVRRAEPPRCSPAVAGVRWPQATPHTSIDHPQTIKCKITAGRQAAYGVRRRSTLQRGADASRGHLACG